MENYVSVRSFGAGIEYIMKFEFGDYSRNT